jgi:ABC-2 type transport system permease protein
MQKLLATITKDFRILMRDKVGLAMMFVMPILLALIITAVQNSTFELVNHNRIKLLVCNKDTGDASRQLFSAIEKTGMFDVISVPASTSPEQVTVMMHEKDAMVSVIIPNGFSSQVNATADNIAGKALKNFDLQKVSPKNISQNIYPLTLYYHPALQGSFRESMEGTLKGALQLVQNKQIVRTLYSVLNEKEIPDTLENEIVNNQIPIHQIPVSRSGTRNIPNATQHNIPAWTIFAMFFVVISLGSTVVREKMSGSFIRLKTLPTNYLVALLSKQITYLTVTFAQAAVIFSIGTWLFPHIGLPPLNLPSDIIALIIVSLICGWCAVSYAICIGVFAGSQEQANGFGAVSILILAALGGLLVPGFAMPDIFKNIMKLSPLHWGLEAYYGLFLEGGKLKDVLMNILPLFGITIFIQLITLYGLKRKNLI